MRKTIWAVFVVMIVFDIACAASVAMARDISDTDFRDITRITVVGSTLIGGFETPIWANAYEVTYDPRTLQSEERTLKPSEADSARACFPILAGSRILFRNHPSSFVRGIDQEIPGGLVPNDLPFSSPELNSIVFLNDHSPPSEFGDLTRQVLKHLYYIDVNERKLILVDAFSTRRTLSYSRGGISASKETFACKVNDTVILYDIESAEVNKMDLPGKFILVTNGLSYLLYDDSARTYTALDGRGHVICTLVTDSLRVPMTAYAITPTAFIVQAIDGSDSIFGKYPCVTYLLDLKNSFVLPLGPSTPSGFVTEVKFINDESETKEE